MVDVATLGLAVRSDGVPVATKRLRELEGQSVRNEGAAARLNKSLKGMAAEFAAVTAATFGMQAIVSTLAGFEKSMAAVAAITRATDAELAALRDTAKQLGATTEFTASQAADALKFLGMAGWSASQSMAAIPAVLDLATAAQMDLARAADISSNIMSAFGLSAGQASQAADILAAASSRANTDVAQLGDGMKYVGPIASALGISMSDTAAAMGVLSDAGLQGSMAGTGLRQVLSSLANTTPQATKALQALGLDVAKLNPATTSIVDIIGQLKDAGLDAATALTVFGDRGAPAVLALIEGATKLGTLTDELKNVDGEAKRMAETMRNQLQGDLNGLMSALEGLIIQMGESGLTAVISNVVQTLTAFARALTGTIASISQVVGAFGQMIGVADALGWSVNLLKDNMDVLMAAAVATAAFFAGQLALSLGPKIVASALSGAGSLLMYSASLGATSVASAAAALSMQALRVAISVMLGPIGIAISIIGALTAVMFMNGRETQRLKDIQSRYTESLEQANRAAETSKKRLEDYRLKMSGAASATAKATEEIDRFAKMSEEIAKGRLSAAIAAVSDEADILATQLEFVKDGLSDSGATGATLFEIQSNKARALTAAVMDVRRARVQLTAAEEAAAKTQAVIDRFGASAGAAAIRRLDEERAAVGRATQALEGYEATLQNIIDLNVDAFAGDLFDEQQRAAEAAAEKVQEMIAGLKQQLVIDGERNALQKEIVSNLFAAGLAANDNTAGARQIRDLTKELYDLDVARTQEAKNLEQTKNFATTIEDLEIEIDQLGRLREALRLGDEAHAAMAETIAIENMIRRASVEGVNLESEAFQAQIDRIRELVRERNFLSGAYEIAGASSPGGLSETDRTRRRERFEELETDLIAGIDNPATRLKKEYDQRMDILKEFHARTEDEIRRHKDAALELDRQYELAKLELNLSSGQQIAGAMAGAFRQMLGEQSAAYKAMFAIQQAFVIASAALSISNAMAQALGDPSKVTLEQKLAAWATIAAASTQIMTAINSVALGFADGGYTGAGGKYDVAGVVHKGEVVWSQKDVARYGGWQNVDAMRRGIMPAANDNGGGGGVLHIKVTVDDEGHWAAYVNDAVGQGVNAAVTISDQRSKARMDSMQSEARRPVISARGAA